MARRLTPDVVLMDVRMPVMDGIEATAAICGDRLPCNVLILTTFEGDKYVVAALCAGASGFIGKSAEPEDIVRAIAAVHTGDSLFSPAATRALISRYVTAPESSRRNESVRQLGRLTERERGVLLAVGQGLSNQEIAESFFISPHTAKTHVNRIMSKVCAHDRSQLVILCYESGLLVPGR